MDNCFRFLINVDQCLNMSAFDMFFYRLESKHKFRGYSAQLTDNSLGFSLPEAARQIRGYLDQYPYHVGDMQLVVAMRGRQPAAPVAWGQTLLCRLLQLSKELQAASISLHSHAGSEKVLNLIMLYDGEATQATQESYLSSRRFREDQALMLAQLGLHESESSREAVEQALAEYEAAPENDPTPAACVRAYLAAVAPAPGACFAGLGTYLEDRLASYRVFEATIDRNDRRQNLLGLLRVVEFINMPVDGDGDAVTSLARRCAENWQQVWADRELEQRYGSMLRQYASRLTGALGELERPDACAVSELPPQTLPGEQDIHPAGGSGLSPEELQSPLDRFCSRRRPSLTHWEQTLEKLEGTLLQLEQQLEQEAGALAGQYAAALAERKQQNRAQLGGQFVSGPDGEQQLRSLEQQRAELFQEMRERRMDPGIRSQDRLNIQNALKEADSAVRGYLQWMAGIRVGTYVAFVLLSVLGLAGLYALQQPYVFAGWDTMKHYLMYLGFLLLGALMGYRAPHDYYLEQIRRTVGELKQKLEQYVPRYTSQAEDFLRYINILNRLDALSGYHTLLARGEENKRRLRQCCLWHKVQLEKHLHKLEQFRGLMELSADGEEPQSAMLLSVSDATATDVMNSPIYWPQGDSGL